MGEHRDEEQETGRLSAGNSKEKDLTTLLTEMLWKHMWTPWRTLAGTYVDPDTIERIPSEYDVPAPDGVIVILTDPLPTGASNESSAAVVPPRVSSSDEQNWGIKRLMLLLLEFLDRKLIGPKLGNKNVDKESEYQMPSNADMGPTSRAFSPIMSVEANLTVATVGAAAIIGHMASGKQDSPSVRVFSAASALGFNCSLLAAFTTVKNPKVSGFLSKFGAIGTAAAVTVALGDSVGNDMFGNIYVKPLVITLICIIYVVVILR